MAGVNSAAESMHKAAIAVRAYERQVIVESRVGSLPRKQGEGQMQRRRAKP
jgi:hypothetical protein